MSPDQISEQIVNPNSEVAAGFQPGVMPQNYGEILQPDQLQQLVDYLPRPPAAPAAGAAASNRLLGLPLSGRDASARDRAQRGSEPVSRQLCHNPHARQSPTQTSTRPSSAPARGPTSSATAITKAPAATNITSTLKASASLRKGLRTRGGATGPGYRGGARPREWVPR